MRRSISLSLISVVVGSLCVKPPTLFLPKAVANIKKSSLLFIHSSFDSAYSAYSVYLLRITRGVH